MAWWRPQGFAVCFLEKEGHPFITGLSLVQCSKHAPGTGIRWANSFVCDRQCSVSNTWKREKRKKQANKQERCQKQNHFTRQVKFPDQIGNH